MTKYEKLKLCLLTFFVVGFLLCFYNYSENGRHVFSNRTDGKPMVIDSKTGIIYSLNDEYQIDINQFPRYKNSPK
jgi:hypothetical protein